MIRKLVLTAAAGPVLGAAAANTVSGTGQDLESAENSVDRTM